MGNILKLSGILFLVAGIAAGTLAFYNAFTKPEIDKLNARLEAEAKQYVLEGMFKPGEMDDLYYEEVDVEVNGRQEKFWKVKKSASHPDHKAFVFLTRQRGFDGIIETMVGTDKNLKINRIKVINHSETPGLGAEVSTVRYGEDEPYFETWFKGKSALKVVVEKDDPSSEDRVQSITGATITTKAICDGINEMALVIDQFRKTTAAPKKILVDPKHVVEVDFSKLREDQEETESAEETDEEEK